jgi:uncharacterized protein involved in exopolysaccharide biosynthesis
MEFRNLPTKSSTGLQQYWLILKRRWPIGAGVCALIFASVLLAVSLKKPNYVAEGTLRFERTSPTSSLTGVGKEIYSLEPLVERNDPLATEAEVIRSTPLVKEVIEELNLKDRQGMPLKPRDFLKRLKVAEVRGTDILKVSYTNSDPNKAAAVTNTLMDVYINYNIQSHRVQAAAAYKFAEESLPRAEAAVSQAEESLSQFEQTNKIVALDEEAASTVSGLSDLQKQVTALETQIVDTEAQAAELQRKMGINSQQALSLTALSQSPGVQQALAELQKVQTQLAVERSRYSEITPPVVNLRNREASLRQLLEQRVANVVGSPVLTLSGNMQMGELQQNLTRDLVLLGTRRQGLVQQLAVLSRTQNAYRRRAEAMPLLKKTQRELERRLEVSQTTYSQLLQKTAELRVAEGQNVGNAFVLAPADIPDKPTSAKATILAAVLLSILGAGAAMYILEQWNQETLEESGLVENAYAKSALSESSHLHQGK